MTISPEGRLYFHDQDRITHSGDVVAVLEHLLREVQPHAHHLRRRPDSSQPSHQRLPAYAPDLNPDEGVWQQLKGVELRNPCRVDLPHLRRYCVMPSNESGGSHVSSKAASRGWTSTRYAPVSNSSCQGESAAQSLLVCPSAYSRISGWNLNSAGSRRSTVPRT